MRSLFLGLFAGCVLTAPAGAAAISFSGATPGSFTGPVTEAGFTYSRTSGLLSAVAGPGVPMPNVYLATTSSGGRGGGELSIVSATAGEAFTFVGIDFADIGTPATGSLVLTVTGLSGTGTVLGTDTYTLGFPAVSIGNQYTNWTTESASRLAGVAISQLIVDVPFSAIVGANGTGAIDNIVLGSAVAAPEPAALAVLALAVPGLLGARARRRLG